MVSEERLEMLLVRYRTELPPLRLRRRRHKLSLILPIAAAIALAVGLAFLKPKPSWKVGSVIHATKPVTISSAIATIDIAAGTSVAIASRSRLKLQQGTIHARTTAAPGVFIVDLPTGKAVDLGCEYTLTVTPSGAARLHVDAGWVALEPAWRQSIVPEGASAELVDDRVTPPLFDDASPQFKAAARQFALTSDAVALRTLLPLARRRDALTLINLFRGATTNERLMLWDRLNALVPAPVPRDAMLTWTMGATDPWWPLVMKASGVKPLKKGRVAQ